MQPVPQIDQLTKLSPVFLIAQPGLGLCLVELIALEGERLPLVANCLRVRLPPLPL